MSRVNGKLSYSTVSDPIKDPVTGFLQPGGGSEWVDGIECQLDKQAPAKQILGTDGQMHAYTYDVFIKDMRVKGKLNIGTECKVITEDGNLEEFTVTGVDETRKYIELWG